MKYELCFFFFCCWLTILKIIYNILCNLFLVDNLYMLQYYTVICSILRNSECWWFCYYPVSKLLPFYLWFALLNGSCFLFTVIIASTNLMIISTAKLAARRGINLRISRRFQLFPAFLRLGSEFRASSARGCDQGREIGSCELWIHLQSTW